ncbi:hypothetical protein FRC10_002418 [Ceratobasidium sp. 414]|nr:hypothetical protein FRC10_002418 [Ceratobasidium sp. 414]
MGEVNDEAEGNNGLVVDDASEHIDILGDHEGAHTGGDMGTENVEVEELVQLAIEMPPNEANLVVHNTGVEVPLDPAHGLRRNLPITIVDWPDPEADPEAEDELLDDDEPVVGPDRDPEYVEHDIPPGLDPIDEPRLADDVMRDILQRHLGDLAVQQWVDMYDHILSKQDRSTLRMLAACLRTHFSRDTWDDLRQGVNIKIWIDTHSATRHGIMRVAIQDNFITILPSSHNSVPSSRTRRCNYRFFDNPQDLVLGISTDGFSLFKCWRRIRNHIENIICVGIIPGPKQCKDLNSFLIPLLEELLALEEGVEVGGFVPGEDVAHNFLLHVFLILSFGNIPVVAKMLLIKAHNAKVPCRACVMQAISCQLSEQKSVYYIPLMNPSTMNTLPINELPMCLHAQMLTILERLVKLNVPHKKKSERSILGIQGLLGSPSLHI